MKKVVIDDNILYIGNSKIIVKYPIKQVECINEKFIVLLTIPRVELGVEELNNIFCYDENGKLFWQISNELPLDIACKEQMPYIAIQIMNGKLYATDFWGRKFNVDAENGKLMDVKIVH